MNSRFENKVVLVIGGNSGIGLSTAKAFSDEGARLVITGRDPDSLANAAKLLGPSALVRQCDIADLGQLAALFDSLHATLDRIDVLFVNAGVLSFNDVESVTETEWDWVYRVNVKGAFFAVQHALPFLRSGSAIVATGSAAGRKAEPSALVYATTKAALRSLVRNLAASLVSRGIRVNLVSPGPTETPIFVRALGATEDIVQGVSDDVGRVTPMKRFGRPEEVAAAVLFLASDAASFITGVDLLVDGGVASF